MAPGEFSPTCEAAGKIIDVLSPMTDLVGLRVWVTRPRDQADGLRAAIEAAGGRAVCRPLLEIEPPADPDAARDALAQAEQADDLIFTSVNAVARAWRLKPDFAPGGRVAAVGRATARSLERRLGRPVRFPASDWSSEGLLALPEFTAPAGRTVALVTGEGGRGVLQPALASRGADVVVARVYRRRPAPLEPEELKALLARVNVIVITSSEALRHLAAATPAAQRALLRSRQLVVPSSRVLKQVRNLDFASEPICPARMDDAAVVAALARLAAERASREGSAGR